MSRNLIEIAQGYLSDAVISKIASTIGLDANAATPIIGKAFPILLGAIGLKTKTEEGTLDLFETIAGADAGFVEDLDGQLTGDNTEIVEAGQNTLSGLLGDNFSFVKTAMGAIPGLSSGKIGGLLGILTPFLTGLLKKQVTEQNLDASGLASLIDEQKSYIGGALGGDFLKKTGLGALASIGSVAGIATGAAHATGDALGSAGTSAGDATRAAGSTISGAASAASGKASGAAGTIGGAASSMGSGVAGRASGAVDGAGAASQKAGGGFMKILPILLIGVLAFFGIKMCGKSPDSSASAPDAGTAPGAVDIYGTETAMNGEGAGGVTGGLEDGATDLGSETSNSIGGAAGDATVGIRDGAADLGNKAMDSAGSAAASASDGMNDTADAMADTLGGMKEGAADLGNKTMGSAGDAASSASAGMDDTANAMADTLGGIKDGAADLGNKAMGSAGDAAGSVTDGMNDAAGAAGDALGGVEAGAADLENKTMGLTGEVTGAAAGAVSDTAGSATNAAGEMMDKMKDSSAGDAGGAADSMAEKSGSVAEVPSFVPDSEDGAPSIKLSEKAAGLARGLSSIKVPDGGDLDSLYASFGADNDSQFLYRIPFATGQTGVPSSHETALITKLKEADPNATIVTIGYADVRGDDALNKRLSYGRAKEIGEWIKGTIGSDTSIESFSMGETDRFSKSDFSKNRVVEVWQIK